ncbi:MAG: peptidoglycan DD-metalloendopeptidase family protein [Candidatus Alkaliphilus sp. MAG34]|nr:M23 family metallopeptidase [Clostridiales bacterium]
MSPKKNNNDGEDNKDKKLFDRIKDRQGFYTILILCIVIITATALWVDNQQGDPFISEGPTNPFGEDEQPEITLVEDDEKDTDKTQETGKIGEGKPADGKVTDSKKKPQEKGNENTVEKDSKTEKTKKSSAEKYNEIEETMATFDPEDMEEVLITETMAVPVTGKLTLPFAEDHLVYHKTLDQWSTHKGIDIKAEEGAPVKAALDGEVVEVINDTIMGITIVIRHDSELSTIYSNLSTDAMVEVGEQVKKGQTISGVGKTASNKTLEGPLLHFQVLRGDKFVNPELYLGKISES